MTHNWDAQLPDGTFHKLCGMTINATWKKWYILSKFILFFVIILIIMMCLFIKMSFHLVNQSKYMANHGPKRGHKLQKSRKKVIYLLLAVIVSFCVCLLPYQILTIWIMFSNYHAILTLGHDQFVLLLNLSRVLSFINSTANPVIYNFLSRDFRKSIRIYFSKKTKLRKYLMESTRRSILVNTEL